MSLSTSEVTNQAKSKSLLKKIVIISTAVFGLLMLAAISLPFLIDVDKYRPFIVEQVNSEIDGKLEIGKLSLSLWGRVDVRVDGLKLTDSAGRTAIEVKDAGAFLPFWSFLVGSPRLNLQMTAPNILAVKERDGTLNFLKLTKRREKSSSSESEKSENGTEGDAVTKGQKTNRGTELPGLVLNSRITVLLKSASLTYQDELTGDRFKVDDLNFTVRDVSPSSEMPFEIGALTDVAMKNGMKIKGPVSVSGLVKAESSGDRFEKANFQANVKADDATVTFADSFAKEPGTPLSFEASGEATESTVQIKRYKVQLAEIVATGDGSFETVGNSSNLALTAKVGPVELSSLGNVSPAAKAVQLSGQFELDTKVSGTLSAIQYEGNAKLSNVALQSENMKQKLDLDADAIFATNEIKNLTIKLTAKEFDLGVSGSVQNFSAPKFRFNVKSAVLDLDALLKSSAKAAERRAEASKSKLPAGNAGGASGSEAENAVVDYNAMFKPLRENPIAAAANGAVTFDLKRVRSTGVTMENLKGELLLDQLLVRLKDFSMKIFDGTVAGQASFNARNAKPETATNLVVTGLESKKMVESQMPFAKNTIQGTVSAKLNIGGSGVNPTDMTSSWSGSGTMNVKEAVFATLDLGRQIKDGALGKLPEALRNKIGVSDKVLDWKGEYQTVEAKYNLANGVFNLVELTGKAYPNKGMDLKGSGKVQLKNYGLDLGVDFIDTYNWLNADQYVKDERYGHFALPAKVGGTLFAPKFDWGAALGKLAQGAAKQQAKDALKKGILDKVKLPGSGDAKPSDAVKGLMKGLFN